MAARSMLLSLGVAGAAAVLLTGCGGGSSARVADRIAGAVAPCGSAGGGGAVAPVAAVALAAAGASSMSARCPGAPGGTGAAIRAPTSGGAPTGPITGVVPTRWVDPPPHTDPTLPEPGRYECSTADGDSDVIVAETLELAREVCRELTGERCSCEGG